LQSTANSITITLTPSPDDGGSIITDIVLEISDFLTTNWIQVSTYDGSSLVHTLTVADDSLIPFTIYRFRVKTVNFYGDSPYSAEISIAVAPLPSQPAPVTKY
jgi:hypothetical protein